MLRSIFIRSCAPAMLSQLLRRANKRLGRNCARGCEELLGLAARRGEKATIDSGEFAEQIDVRKIRLVIAHHGAGGGENAGPKLLCRAVFSP